MAGKLLDSHRTGVAQSACDLAKLDRVMPVLPQSASQVLPSAHGGDEAV